MSRAPEIEHSDRWRVMLGAYGGTHPMSPGLVAPGEGYVCANGDPDRLWEAAHALNALRGRDPSALPELEEAVERAIARLPDHINEEFPEPSEEGMAPILALQAALSRFRGEAQDNGREEDHGK